MIDFALLICSSNSRLRSSIDDVNSVRRSVVNILRFLEKDILRSQELHTSLNAFDLEHVTAISYSHTQCVSIVLRDRLLDVVKLPHDDVLRLEKDVRSKVAKLGAGKKVVK